MTTWTWTPDGRGAHPEGHTAVVYPSGTWVAYFDEWTDSGTAATPQEAREAAEAAPYLPDSPTRRPAPRPPNDSKTTTVSLPADLTPPTPRSPNLRAVVSASADLGVTAVGVLLASGWRPCDISTAVDLLGEDGDGEALRTTEATHIAGALADHLTGGVPERVLSSLDGSAGEALARCLLAVHAVHTLPRVRRALEPS